MYLLTLVSLAHCCPVLCLPGISLSARVWCYAVQVFLRNPLKQYYPPPSLNNCSDVNTTSLIAEDVVFLQPNSTAYNISLDSVTCKSATLFQYPNTALLSVILTGGTFLLAYNLKKFRNSKFLGRSVSIVSEFAVLFANQHFIYLKVWRLLTDEKNAKKN